MPKQTNTPGKKVVHKHQARVSRFSSSFTKVYALFGLLTLLISSGIWALLGARAQQVNADQLVNSYLFESRETFQGAYMPGAHTFLLKWPIFLLFRVFGYSHYAFEITTVLTVLLTVGALAWVIHRIDSRPMVYGTIMLALASILLLVPAQPYAGGILPVNMAMLTTRNLEYVVFIAALGLLLRSPYPRRPRFWLGVLAMCLLVASDKLFLTLGAGGAAMSLVIYGARRKPQLVRTSAAWLSATAAATLLASGLLFLVNATKLSHIVDELSNKPYGLVHGAKELVRAIIFAVSGTLTNFGANPTYDVNLARNIAPALHERLLKPTGIGYIINSLLLLVGIFAAIRQTLHSVRRTATDRLDNAEILSLALLWSSVAAVGAFIVTNHYYLVDARYLTVLFFAFAITTAVWLRKIYLGDAVWLRLGVIIVIGMVLSSLTVGKTYATNESAQAETNQRNHLVAESLKSHPVDVLVGDYWRVLPIKQASSKPARVMPLESCTQQRQVLTSKQWQVDLNKYSFAYLLSFDKSLTNFPQCQLQEITNTYGRPNASVLISGKLEHPNEVLLFFDRGAHRSAPINTVPAQSISTVTPVSTDQLPGSVCAKDKQTIVSVVAHEDDDLLFQSPDLLHDIKAGNCVRTVYLTAGDGGSSKLYWLGREHGSEAAYSKMLGDENNIWVERIVKLAENQFVTVANPRGNRQVSIIFMRLPDGNLHGEGFRASAHESLERLETNRIQQIHSADNQSFYSDADLVAALHSIMETYQPNEIRTQAPKNVNMVYPDHSDHKTAGRFARRAHEQLANASITSIKYYAGYPIHAMAGNVTGVDLQQKVAAFLAYSKFDNAVCHDTNQCLSESTYGSYLKRQYMVAP